MNGAAIVAEAYKYIGTPYVWGGKDPSGFDCSGFTRYVYLQVTGRDIGGWTVPQESAGTKISVSQAKAGDLLFWGSAGGTYHVAISLGGGQYICSFFFCGSILFDVGEIHQHLFYGLKSIKMIPYDSKVSFYQYPLTTCFF